MSDYQNLVLSIDNGIAHLQLNRAQKKNAINDQMILELESALQAMTANGSNITVLVLSGAGDSFCSGLDLFQRSRKPVHR